MAIRMWLGPLCAAMVTAAAIARWGAPVVVLLLIALPIVSELAREAGQRAAMAVCAAAVAVAAWWKLPPEALVWVIPWCGVCALMAWVPCRRPVRRGVLWGGLTALAACGALMLLGLHYPGLVSEGLAGDVAAWIDQREDAPLILLQAYQAGLAGLEEELAKVPAIQLFGVLIMPEDVRVELLKGLRTSIALLMQGWLPGLIVGWIGLTGLLCAVAPDAYRRRNGLAGRLPAFGTWRLPKDMSVLMLLLMLGALMRSLATSMITAQMFDMCGSAFQDIYLVLGMCTASQMMKRRGWQRLGRRLILACGAVIAPVVLVMIGMADQFFDLRKLCHSTDE